MSLPDFSKKNGSATLSEILQTVNGITRRNPFSGIGENIIIFNCAIKASVMKIIDLPVLHVVWGHYTIVSRS